MKNKLLLTAVLFFLITGGKAFAQTDTLNVYIEKRPGHRTGVDLVFENNSNDTILLFTKFRNFNMEWGASLSGIFINKLHNGKEYVPTWGEEMPIEHFVFSKGFTLINPKSKVKLFFNIDEYFWFPEKSSDKYEISFFINYIYSKYHSSDVPSKVTYFETNRVTIVEATEDNEK